MADRLSKEERGRLMSRVRGKDTKPELLVRKIVTRLGRRYRLHRADLPGRPDLAFIGLRKVIFVHGCFWHRHPRCKLTTTPATRRDFWLEKFARNVERDTANVNRLVSMGWQALIVWECETRAPDKLTDKIEEFLSAR